MKVTQTRLPGVILLEPALHTDPRGFFVESFHEDRYSDAGIPARFVQDNHSHSSRGVLRGLHFQHQRPQGKLVWVVSGKVYDAVVDVRHGSPTFGCWEGVILDSNHYHQLYIPPGFAHGFCVLSEAADFVYKCTQYYDADDDAGIAWDDPDIGIEWPIATPSLSDKDRRHPRLHELDPVQLPNYVTDL